MTSIEWSAAALRDLDSLYAYIARDSQRYADRFVAKLLDSIDKLVSFPALGRRVEESDDELVRELIYRNYRIFYRVEPSRTLILMIVHGGRDLSQTSPKRWEIV